MFQIKKIINKPFQYRYISKLYKTSSDAVADIQDGSVL